MADELADVSFPGIVSIRDASYTRGHGRSPGTASITCYPQARPPASQGDLTFYYGGQRLTIRDCIIDQATLNIDANGQTIGCTILDRRWKWQWPTISGRYNQWKANGDLDTSTQKSPQDLARLCLEAMGEKGFEISKIPNDARPSVDWDYELAAEALESLCETLGCRVVFRLAGNVAIEPVGVGRNLPESADVSSGGATIDPPELPDTIVCIGGPTRHQMDFELEAVGKELNGEVRLLDDLSYKPADGWDLADIGDDLNEIADVKLRKLAQSCVFKMYRVKLSQLFLPGQADGEALIKHAWQIEPLPELIQYDEDLDEPPGPIVYGVWFDDRDQQTNNTSEDIKPLSAAMDQDFDKVAVYQGGFSIDDKELIVRFSETVYKKVFDGANGYLQKPADLRLRLAFNFRDEKTRALAYREVKRQTGATNNTKPRVVKIPQVTGDSVGPKPQNLTYDVAKEYVENSFNSFRTVSNKEAFDAEANYYIDCALKEYKQSEPMTLTYEGLRFDIELDGAIQQISFRLGGGSVARTTVNRNNDRHEYLPSYAERRFRQRTAAANRR